MRRNGNEGGRRVKAEATKRAITMATRVASYGDGDGNGGKSNGDGDEGAGRATMKAMAAATTVVAMRVASDKEGEGGKVMEMVTRLVGKQRQWQQRGHWGWGQGWQGRMQAMARAARAMVMAQRGQLQGGGQWLEQFTK
jgi:hypothetical protein